MLAADVGPPVTVASAAGPFVEASAPSLDLWLDVGPPDGRPDDGAVLFGPEMPVSVGGASFELLGPFDDQLRVAGVDDVRIEDSFLFANTTTGGVTIRFAGLAPGVYDVRSWHSDGREPYYGVVDVELVRPDGTTEMLFEEGAWGPEPLVYTMTIDDSGSHELRFLPARSNAEVRFNGLRVVGPAPG
ncbi:MAG: hypothetical protein AAGD35_05855 [Actinomycetota bacterium]